MGKEKELAFHPSGQSLPVDSQEEKSSAAPVECGWCGEALTEEEIEYPARPDLDPICDECYNEHYRFICCLCDGYGEEEDQHKFLLVQDPKVFEDEARAGIYRIVKFPYYVDAMLSAWLLNDALEFVGPLPPQIYDNEYPSGHLCGECQGKYVPVLQATP